MRTTFICCSSSSLQTDNIRWKTSMFRVLSSDCEAKFLLVSMRTGCNGHLYSYLKHISDPHWWWWVVCATFFLFLSELLIHHNCPPGEHWREARYPRDRVVCGRCAWRQHKGWDMLLRWGCDQMQPQVSRRGIWAASSWVTYIADRSVSRLHPRSISNTGTKTWIGNK